jgi:hypothetical protein
MPAWLPQCRTPVAPSAAVFEEQLAKARALAGRVSGLELP